MPKIVRLPNLRAENVVDPLNTPVAFTRRELQASVPLSALWSSQVEDHEIVAPLVDGILSDITNMWADGIEFDTSEDVDRTHRYRVDRTSASDLSEFRRVFTANTHAELSRFHEQREAQQRANVAPPAQKAEPAPKVKTPMDRAREYMSQANHFGRLNED